jgi:hypothetical protein
MANEITAEIRAFFEKMARGTPETKFCNFKIFFERDEQDLKI